MTCTCSIDFLLVIYQTRKTTFDHISKHLEEVENTMCSGLCFFTNFEVFCSVVIHCLECLIYCIFLIETKTKEKTDKRNRKNLC